MVRKEDNSGRLMLKNPHSANLAHNIIPLGGIGSGGVPAASVRHDQIFGSDLAYYPMDVTLLLQMLGILLGATTGIKEQWESLLILPLPPNAKRQLLGKLLARLATATNDDGWLVG
jgi:hypothetical protein